MKKLKEMSDEELLQSIAEEKKTVAKRDEEMKAKGYKWKLTYWIHGDGDDKCYDEYHATKPAKPRNTNDYYIRRL